MLALWTAALLCWGGCGAAVPGDPWGQCPSSRQCRGKFADGSCDRECTEPECLIDGFDCLKDRSPCNPGHVQYCRDHYANSHCEQGCDSAPCGWDGSDCFRQQSPLWAKGTVVLHTRVPLQRGALANSSLLWALSVLLQTSLRLRGAAPLAAADDLYAFDPPQLAQLLSQTPSHDADGSVLFLQVDNRPCSRAAPSTCFPYATEAASFLRAAMSRRRASPGLPPGLQEGVVTVRGFREEIGSREEDEEEDRGGQDTGDASEATPPWLWAVVGVATGLALVLALAVVAAIGKVRRRWGTEREGGGDRVRHTSVVTDDDGEGGAAKAWARHTPHRQHGRAARDKDRSAAKKKKKKRDKEAEKKRRREPLGEDAMRMRPLKRDVDVGSETDFTQSSMEDVNARRPRRQEDTSICDHRTPDQKHYRPNPSQSQTARPMQPPPRGWERNAVPPLLSPPNQSAPVQWCGPDGSVVLIRAVRSGLDRVVLELLRAGVPVNNTDHTGRSALHWACSVNHLSLTRTLTRYGALLDLQDNKGETSLFLAALHGCYDTARFLLLNAANQELHDRRGRRPMDVAREGMHHQVLELLLAHRVQRAAIHIEPANEMLWEERGLLYSPWVASPGLPGRSSSFSGVIGQRDVTSPQPGDWSMGRVQCPSPQNWRPQLNNQSATALVTPRIMGRPPRPISTLQEVTSEDEDRERPQEAPRAATPHFLFPQPAPRQRSFSCSQHALQRRASAPHQPEPPPNEPVERMIVVPPTDAPVQSDPSVAGPVEPEPESYANAEHKPTDALNNSRPDSTHTAL